MLKYSIPKQFQGFPVEWIPWDIIHPYFLQVSSREPREVLSVYKFPTVSEIEVIMSKTGGDPEQIANELIKRNAKTPIEEIVNVGERLGRCVQVSKLSRDLCDHCQALEQEQVRAPVLEDESEREPPSVTPPPDAELNYLLTQKIAELEQIVKEQKKRIEELERECTPECLESLNLNVDKRYKCSWVADLSLYGVVWNNMERQQLFISILSLVSTNELRILLSEYAEESAAGELQRELLLIDFNTDKKRSIRTIIERFAHAGFQLYSILRMLCTKALFPKKYLKEAKEAMERLFTMI